MNDIYKICELDKDNNVINIIVFYGKSDIDLSVIFKEDPNNSVFKDLFSDSEETMIKTNNIPIQFSSQSIYLDDSIQIIKQKLIAEFSDEIAFEEIYLFAKQIQNVNNISIYENLTHNNYFTLTQDILLQFLSNINNFNVEGFVSKDKYSFDDIIDLNIPPNILVDVPFGQHLISGKDIYNCTVNPFKLIDFSKTISSYSDNLVSTNNKELLLENGFISDNTIYYCRASSILHYAVDKNLSEKITSNIYLPYLVEKDIYTLTSLKSQHSILLEKNSTLTGTKFNKQCDNITLFHDIYNTRKSDLNYIQQGVQHIEFTIKQPYSYNIPLEVIFKLIHANKNIPFIKFNPSRKKENIYRLYCDKVSKNGKKIPFLSKGLIFKLMKSIKGSKKVLEDYKPYL
jgi:hypothetical protein